jgi:tetratricopeptide (TPR) repeat protein
MPSSRYPLSGVLLIAVVFVSEPQSLRDTVHVRVLREKAVTFQHTYPDSMLYYGSKSLELAQKLPNRESLAKSHNVMGIYYWMVAEYSKSLEHYQKALDINTELGRQGDVANQLGNISLVYGRLGDYATSIEYLFKAIEIGEVIGDTLRLSRFYNSLGVTYKNLGSLQDAEKYYGVAIGMYEKIDDQTNLAGAWYNLASVLELQQRFDEAEQYHLKALGLFEELDVARGRIVVLSGLGELYLKMDRIDDALETARQSVALSQQRGFPSHEVNSLMTLAKAQLASGQVSEALKTFQVSYGIARAKNYKQVLPELYRGLANAHAASGNYRLAAEFFQKHVALKDSLQRHEAESSIANLRIAYEIQRKEKEFELIQKDHRIQLLRRNNAIAYTLIGLVMVGITGFFIVLNLRKRKRRLERRVQLQRQRQQLMAMKLQNQELKEMELRSELERRNSELSSYTLNLLQKNELLNNIKSELKNISADDPAKVKKQAQQIISSANFSFLKDKEWSVFKQYFESAHSGFLTALVNQFPELSVADRKLAALLKLDLNSEQIASIMGISPPSVKVARHRLRKKLRLEPGDNMGIFLARLDASASMYGEGDADEVLTYFRHSLEIRQTLDEAAWDAAKNLIVYLKFEDCVVYFIDHDRRVLVQRAAYGPKSPSGFEILAPLEIPIGKGICGYVALTGQPVLVTDTRLDPRYIVDDEVRLSELAVPILVGGEPYGIIDSEHSKAGFFIPVHLKIMQGVARLLAEKIVRLQFDSQVQ